MTWEGALPQLQTDARFTNSPLSSNQQIHLFHSHIGRIRSKHLDNLRDLLESHAPSLATSFSELPLQTLLSSLPAVKLGYDIEQLEQEFSRWQRERTQMSRRGFDEMLSENSFVEFWGRLSKMGGDGVEGSVKIENEDIGEGGGDSGASKVDMKSLAKNIDIQEMEKVLKSDKRFIVFDHVPMEREQWLRVRR
ncbi:hypothetical protein K443DRAFT_129658 [Laccaria amethystina LaAM-08-1]|uniref:Unplaced genomic scaffold K443scaffold_16, whole genome shotgun sequence n=1 Tax=Laccaria amethystina LaAM-08-1 TaxID=1095629 RepID=A0A0C9XYG1_9AGAR|nr:hypothetical protein K443DRAFT_129658 [Laccaria amethystina LaAM-08-1]